MKKILFLVASVMMALTVGAQPAGHFTSHFLPRKTMSHPGADALLPTEKYVTSYENGRKVLVLDSVSDDGTYWMYNGRYTYLYDNSGNCVEYHYYDDMDREVERSHYSYDHTMPLSSTLIPWNPEIDRPRTYDNADACVREAWYSLDVDHVLQYVCDYIYEYNDIAMATQNTECQKVSVYPNPVSDRVVLAGLQGGVAEVQVYDLSGQLLSVRTVLDTTTEVDLSAFAPGCYLLKVTQGTTAQVVKLMVEK